MSNLPDEPRPQDYETIAKWGLAMQDYARALRRAAESARADAERWRALVKAVDEENLKRLSDKYGIDFAAIKEKS